MRAIGFAAVALLVTFMSGCSRVPGSGDKPVIDFGETQRTVLGPRIWSQRSGDLSSQFGRAVAVDSDGSVIVAGEFYGTMNFGCSDLTIPGGSFFPDTYVAKLSSSGGRLWSLQFNNSADGYAHGVALDSQNNVYVVAEFLDRITLPFPCDPLSTAAFGNANIVLAKFGPSGDCIKARECGDGPSSYGNGIAVDSFDSVTT